MVDVFEQVEEELRSERYKRLARTWLPIGGAVAAVALIGALGWWGYDSWQTNSAEKAAVSYQRGMEALAAGNVADANTAFGEAAESGTRGYKALALMQQAAIALEQNKNEEAIRLFDEAAKAGRDPILSDGAALKAAYLLVDTASLEDMTARLEPLTGDKRPYSALAQEALATVQLLHNKTDDARATFVQLQLGQDVPETVRQRANVAVQLIDAGTHGAVRQIVTEASKLPATPAPAAAAAEAPAAQAPADQAPAAPAPAAQAPAVQ